MHLDGNAATVVLDRDARVDVDGHVDASALACEGLVYRVVHHLEHEVVKPAFAGVPDVHARTLANSLQTFEDL
jgi:hypothetical protein